MNDLVQDELKTVLQAWRSGEAVRSIALGHSMRETESAGERVQEFHVFRQKKTHAFVFDLIEANFRGLPFVDFALFDTVAQEKAKAYGLSAEERAAGVSLAWVALRRGWTKAIGGFSEAHAINVKRESEA